MNRNTSRVRSPSWTLTHQGKTYRGRPITPDIEVAFENWLAGNLMAALLEQRGDGTDMQVARVVGQRQAQGRYHFRGPVARQALATPVGILVLSRLVFDCSEDEMLGLLAARGEEVKTIVLGIFEAFQQSVPPTRTGTPGSR